MNPHHEIFTYPMLPDITSFYKDELDLRKICEIPPFFNMIIFYFHSRFQDRVNQVALEVKEMINHVQKNHFSEIIICGPKPANIEKKVNKFTWCLLLKGENRSQLHSLVKTIENNYSVPSGVEMKIDVDPYQMQ